MKRYLFLTVLFLSCYSLVWAGSEDLVQVTDFVAAPGNILQMYKYIPADMPANAPLVVVKMPRIMLTRANGTI